MTLVELDAKLLRHESRVETYRQVRAGVDPLNYTDADIEEVTGPKDWYVKVDTLAEAQGISFLCPLCFSANKGSVGTHRVRIGFTGKAPPGTFSQNKAGEDVRWDASGSGLHDLVLTPSIALDTDGPGCHWHGFVGSNGVPPGEAA